MDAIDRGELGFEVAKPGGYPAGAYFALDGTHGPSVFGDDEVDLPFVGIPEVAEFDVPALVVLQEVDPFEKVGGDEVFKGGCLPVDFGPVVVVVFLLLFDGPETLVSRKGRA